MSVPQIFEYPTIKGLAEVVGSAASMGPDVLGTSSERVSLKPAFDVEHRDHTPCESYPLIGINQASSKERFLFQYLFAYRIVSHIAFPFDLRIIT